VRNAHSLWLETLGELGLIGLLLVGGAFALGIGAGVARLRRAPPDQRTTIAALVAVLAAFVLGAAIDWIWQLPVVAAVGLLALGLLVGPATTPAAGAVREPPAARRLGARAALVLAAWVVVCVQAIPFLVSRELDASREAVARGDVPEAIARARSAEAIQPWAASPRLQLALAYEEAGRLDRGRRAIAAAIERDSGDWRLQLIAARLATKDGDIAAARRALARTRELNPRSQLLRAAP
jgi:O-antigen ligase